MFYYGFSKVLLEMYGFTLFSFAFHRLDSGKLWDALGCSGVLWGGPGSSGEVWDAMRSFGRPWEALGSSGGSWSLLDIYNCFREIDNEIHKGLIVYIPSYISIKA